MKYNVMVSVDILGHVIVEADNPEEAQTIAEQAEVNDVTVDTQSISTLGLPVMEA